MQMRQLLTELICTLLIKRLWPDIFQQQKALLAMMTHTIHFWHPNRAGARQQGKLVGFPGKKRQHLAAVTFDKDIVITVANMPGGMDITTRKGVTLSDFGVA
jgi:hypothetical protein